MNDVPRKKVFSTGEWHTLEEQRDGQRNPAWNFVLLPLGLIVVSATWSGLMYAVWCFHQFFYPHHDLDQFFGPGIGLWSFVLQSLMVLGMAPASFLTAMASANFVAWLIHPTRSAFEAQSAVHPDIGVRESNRRVFKYATWMIPTGMAISLLAAYFLEPLKC